MTHQIINADCIEAMKAMPENSVDSIVTDPPYELGFMGKKWDSTGIAFNVEVWREALRVLKPGGHLIAFSGSRTYHRMAVAIEDAGFEIRDQIMWIYGSGFPKSMDISKQIDKNNGEPNRLLKFTNWMRTTGLKAKDIDLILRENNLISQTSNMAVHFFNDGQPQIATSEMWKVIRPLIAEVPDWVDELVQRIEAEREITGMHNQPAAAQTWMQKYGLADKAEAKERRDIPATDAAKQWQGWGTALKPAHEPMVLARKPLIGTVAANVLEYGTGGLNIDASRVGNEGGTKRDGKADQPNDLGWENMRGHGIAELNAGRFPANVIHDGSDEVVELFPDTGKSGVAVRRNGNKAKGMFPVAIAEGSADVGFHDSGSAARFFYCAKASKRDRNEGLDGFEAKQSYGGGSRHPDSYGDSEEDKALLNAAKAFGAHKAPNKNHHPTVKPVDLMRYLCRLITPPNGIVLDPFMGSGSTGKGAVYEGFDFIGIEQSSEYCEIANARINFAIENRDEDLFS